MFVQGDDGVGFLGVDHEVVIEWTEFSVSGELGVLVEIEGHWFLVGDVQRRLDGVGVDLVHCVDVAFDVAVVHDVKVEWVLWIKLHLGWAEVVVAVDFESVGVESDYGGPLGWLVSEHLVDDYLGGGWIGAARGGEVAECDVEVSVEVRGEGDVVGREVDGEFVDVGGSSEVVPDVGGTVLFDSSVDIDIGVGLDGVCTVGGLF